MKIKAGLEADYRHYKEINDDAYSACVVTYGEKWADLMEAHIAAASNPQDVESALKLCAEDTSHQADTEGITGFMYGAAVSGLAKFWEHGDALRRWHNAKYGVSEEKAKGGTVNPAIVTIDPELPP